MASAWALFADSAFSFKAVGMLGFPSVERVLGGCGQGSAQPEAFEDPWAVPESQPHTNHVDPHPLPLSAHTFQAVPSSLSVCPFAATLFPCLSLSLSSPPPPCHGSFPSLILALQGIARVLYLAFLLRCLPVLGNPGLAGGGWL